MTTTASLIQVEAWDLLKFLVTLLIAFMGCIFAFGKLLGSQIDKRLDEKFKAQEEARKVGGAALLEHINRHIDEGDRTAAKVIDLERDFLKWRGDLPIHYVRREDYVRGQTVIEAKLDALYNKLEVVQTKGTGHG